MVLLIGSETSLEGQMVDAAIQRDLIDPWIAAASTALGELAGAAVGVQGVSRRAISSGPGDISALVEITAARGGFMILRLPERTASAVAARMLTEAQQQPDEALVRDCVGELANVIAGQAKAMLAGGPYQFTFSIPRVSAGDLVELPARNLPGMAIALVCEHGPFTLHLLLTSS